MSLSTKPDELLNIVSFIGRDWEFWQRRPHMEGLSQYSRLLCVEPPITIDTPFRKHRIFWEWLTGRRGLRQLSDTLWLYKPVAVVPYYVSFRFPFLGGINRVAMRASLRRILNGLDMKDVAAVMINHPAQQYLIGMLSERLLCYDVYDAYAEIVTLSAGARRSLITGEEKILSEANVVFTSAHHLMESRKRLNPNTYFVPNTADVVLFMKALEPATQIPSDLLQVKEPRVGLIGNVTENHTDIELFNYLAEKHPEWSIVVIGRLEVSARFKQSPDFVRWQNLPNIHYLGFRAYETLPTYLKGLNVCLLPYKINEYTKNVFPNKLFQYLAGGKPVVSTDIPEMRPYQEIIAVAENYAKFERLVGEALESSNPEKIAQRVEVARENSTEKRAQTRIEIIQYHLNELT